VKPAIWSKVASAIKSKYGLTWEQSREVYKKLKSTAPRQPSLRMVAGLPDKLPKNLKGARVKNPAKRAKVQNTPVPEKQTKAKYTKPPKLEKAEIEYYRKLSTPEKPPVKIELAPPPVSLGPAIVPKRQGARNQFEEILKNAGLPVAAIARNETGKVIASKWRDKDGQEKLVKLLKQTFAQIKRDGAMKPQTKERLAVQLEKMLGVKRSNVIWNNIMRQLYGKKGKK